MSAESFSGPLKALGGGTEGQGGSLPRAAGAACAVCGHGWLCCALPRALGQQGLGRAAWGRVALRAGRAGAGPPPQL